MDIIQEIRSVNSRNDKFLSIMKNMEQEKEEMNKKIHLIRVLGLVESIEEKIKNGCFKKKNVASLELAYGVYGIISHAFYEFGGEYADDQEIDGLGTIFRNINEFKTRYANKSFESGKRYKIRLNKNAKEKLLDALLSDELKKTLEYSQMYSEMELSNTNQNKKPKL